MPETSLQFRARRGVTPDTVYAQRTRGSVFGPGILTHDLSRGVPFEQNKGRDTSLAVKFTRLRAEKRDQMVERAIGVDSQEARLTASEGVKVRLGGPEDSDGEAKLPKTIEGIQAALTSMVKEQIINTQQAFNIGSEASRNMNDALTTILNILHTQASSPGAVKSLLNKPAINTSDLPAETQKQNLARITQINEQKWQTFKPIKNMRTYRVTHQGVPMDVVPRTEYMKY